MDWEKRVKGNLRGKRFTISLLRCDRDIPPTRQDRDVIPECEIVCEIDTPMNDLPSFINNNDETWRIIEFQVEMKPCGTTIEFAAWYKNQRQRPVQVKPPFGPTLESQQESTSTRVDLDSSAPGSRTSRSDLGGSPRPEFGSSSRPDLASTRANSSLSRFDLAVTRYDPRQDLE